MRHTPTQAVLPPAFLSQNFLQSISPSQSASPSVAQYSAGLAHDARNMLAAMDIYCELLGAPGVLKAADRHLLEELRLLRDSSGKLLDRLLVEALKCLAADPAAQAASAPGQHAAAGTYSGAYQATYPAPAAYEDRRKPRAIGQRASAATTAQRPGAAPAAPAPYGPADDPANETAGSFAGIFQTPSVLPATPPAVRQTVQPTAQQGTGDAPAARGREASGETGKRVTHLAQELQASLPMLSALAGPRVHVSLALSGCPDGELFIPQTDLTRVLINLVRNAAEAMSVGGRILISASAAARPAGSVDGPLGPLAGLPTGGQETGGQAEEDSGTSGPQDGPTRAVLLSIDDNGPGIPLSLLDRIFDQPVSSAVPEDALRPRLQFRPRGLGLRIVREFVEAGGGTVRALRLPDRGSRFEIVLPLVTGGVTEGGRKS